MKSNTLDSKNEVARAESIIGGGVAGLVSRFAIAPLDVVKIRLQLHETPTRMLSIIKDIVHKEGLTAFWKGNIPAELMYVLYGGVEFATYKYMNHVCSKELGLSDDWNMLVSGGTAGSTATTLTYPLDLLRTRFAAQKVDRVYLSYLSGIKSIYKEEGPIGFVRGLGTSLVSVVPYMSTFFWIYGTTRNLLENNQMLSILPAPEAIAGIIGGTISKTIVFPLDTLRKRLQVTGPNHSIFMPSSAYRYKHHSPSALQIIRGIFLHEGIRGFYKGIGIAVFKSAPTSAVSMWVFERTVSTMRVLKKDNYLDY